MNLSIFNTKIGECGICWKGESITNFFLPDNKNAKITRSLLFNFLLLDKPPKDIKKIIDRVCSHLEGDFHDFSDLNLYQEVTSVFAVDVYEALLSIPAGKVLSYKELAEKVGRPKSSRAIGLVLGQNKIPLLIPCHRVILSSGGLGGYSAGAGVITKQILLDIEKEKI